jgi:hypothetical protein
MKDLKFLQVRDWNFKVINLDRLCKVNVILFSLQKTLIFLLTLPLILFKPQAPLFQISEIIRFRMLFDYKKWFSNLTNQKKPEIKTYKDVYVDDFLVVFDNTKIHRELLQTYIDVNGLLRSRLSKFCKRIYFLLKLKTADKLFIKNTLKGKKIHEIKDEKVLLFTNFYCNNYTHFMVEMMPKLFLMKDTLKDYKILINKTQTLDNAYDKMSYILPILKAFGVEESQIIFINKNEIFKIKTLTSLVNVQFKKDIHNKAFEHIDSYYSREFKTNLGSKLYFARKSTFRKISNEKQVAEILHKHEFVEVEMEKYDLIQQMSIMSNAKTIAGITSTGIFANMSFAKNPLTVLEFRHKANPIYPISYTNLIQQPLNQFFLFCKKKQKFKSFLKADLIVDIKKLNDFLSKNTI